MAKRPLTEELNDAVELMMANPNAPLPSVAPRLAALLQIAAELRDLPTPEFKARLKADLQRRGATAPITVKPIPPGYHSATPCLVVTDPPRAIEFYKQAFGATESMRVADPQGNVMHAEIKVGDSPIAIAPELPEWGNHSPQSLGGSPVIVQLYVEDVDASADQAVAAGATVLIPVADQFYGDRAGRLADPFGHIWIISTHKEDVSPEEMQRRMEAWTHQQAEVGPPSEPSAAESYVVEPYLPVRGAATLIEFLQQAFGAEERVRHTRPDGTIAYAEIKIGDSVVGTGDSALVEAGPMPTAIHLYVPDAEAVYQRARRAGATSTHEPIDQPYGDHEAGVKDAFGNHWYIATHLGPNPIPEGLHSMTSYLHPHGAPQLIDFLKQAFAAEEMFRAQAPDGTVAHAKIRIGQSVVEMGEAHGPYQPLPTVFHLYVNHTDRVYRRALAAGGVSLSEPANQPWGYRNAGVQDPSGNQWWINAPLENVAPEQRTPPEAPVAAVPPGYHTVTPYLTVDDAPKLIDFLKEAFGATEVMRTGDPSGHFHGEVRIGDSIVMMGNAGHGSSAYEAQIYLYVPDVDGVYERALRAGATSVSVPTDQPYGDRTAFVKDPFGNTWFIATHKKPT